MAYSVIFSRRAVVLLRSQRSKNRSITTRVAAQHTVPNVNADVVSTNARDRTPEASSSQPNPTARAKAKRTSPTPLKPGSIDDLSILQNSVILVDKPLGWTSFDVCGKIRNMIRFAGVKKVGHAGTLDPNASGLLIVCTGQGTKFCDDFQAQDKEYSGTMRLGEGTASYDAECEVTERLTWEHITDEDLQAAAAQFVGDIMQVPPMFSAIKVGGQKMYQLAREGQSLELPPRPVTISSLRVWRSEDNRQDIHFYMACSKGTYVRSLAYDMGRALGSAAHLVALRREASGAYRVGDAWQLPKLIEQLDRHKQAFLAAQQQQQQQQQQQVDTQERGREAQELEPGRSGSEQAAQGQGQGHEQGQEGSVTAASTAAG